MRTIGLVILSCFVPGFVLGAAAAASEVTALEIVEKTFDIQTRQLGYELRNVSNKTVTAWRLSLARGDSHGHAQRSLLDQDFYDRLPTFELHSRMGPIAPGGTVTDQWRLGAEGSEDPGRTALSLRVSTVVFDDLTWQGDPDAAAAILEARAARVEEIGRLLTELDRQLGRRRSGEEWAVALRRRAANLQGQGAAGAGDSGGRREVAAVLAATQLELARWLEDAGREVALAPDPQQALGSLIGGLRERYEIGLAATTALDGSGLAEGNGGAR